MDKLKTNCFELYKVGQELTVLLRTPKQGKMPIARTKEGVICRIEKDVTDTNMYRYGSTWVCEIIEVHESKLVLKPKKEVVVFKSTGTIAAVKETIVERNLEPIFDSKSLEQEKEDLRKEKEKLAVGKVKKPWWKL